MANNDYDDDPDWMDYDYEEDPFDAALENCGVLDFTTGECLAAGSEDCDFRCPIRRMIERGDFDDEPDNESESN